MDNSVFVEKTSGLSVSHVSLPNVFPNITQYNNVITVGNTDIILPVGQYTAAQVVTEANAQLVTAGLDFVWGHDGVYFTFSNTALAGTLVLVAPNQETLDWMGLTEITGYSVLFGTTLTAPHPSGLFGEKIVHICCDKLGHGNMVHGADGKLSDVLVTIPLGDTVYHGVAVWQPPTDATYRINYKYVNSITSTLSFTMCDSKMRPLPFSPNHHVQILLKIYHKEHH